MTLADEGGTMRRRRRLLAAAGLAAMFVVGFAALALGLPGAGDPDNPLAVAREASPQSPADLLPDFYVEHSVESIGLKPQTTRLAYEGPDARAWFAIGGQDGRLLNCLITATGAGTQAVYATSCKPPAASGNGLGTYQDTEDSPVLVAGMVPDGFDTARFTVAGKARSAAVSENVLVFSVPAGQVPPLVTLSGPGGSREMRVF